MQLQYTTYELQRSEIFKGIPAVLLTDLYVGLLVCIGVSWADLGLSRGALAIFVPANVSKLYTF